MLVRSLIEVLMPFESFLAVWCSCLSRASWRCGAHAFRERLGSVLQTNQFALMIMQLMRSVWPSVNGRHAAKFPGLLRDSGLVVGTARLQQSFVVQPVCVAV